MISILQSFFAATNGTTHINSIATTSIDIQSVTLNNNKRKNPTYFTATSCDHTVDAGSAIRYY